MIEALAGLFGGGGGAVSGGEVGAGAAGGGGGGAALLQAIPALLQALPSAFGSTSGSSTSKRTLDQLVESLMTGTASQQSEQTTAMQALSAEDQEMLQQAMAGIMGQLTGAQPGAVDFDAVRQSAVAQAIESGMAGVIQQGSGARAYGGTPQATAAEKVAARAAEEGTQAEAAMRLKEQEQLMTALAGISGILKGSQVSQSQLGTTEQQTQQQQSQHTQAVEKTKTKTKSKNRLF